jgi:hydroxymethylglutaryl-CoA lyase
MNMPETLDILEVGPRDGLQNLSQFVETKQKIELIRRLAASGLSHIQLGAFVSPRAVPQFPTGKAPLTRFPAASARYHSSFP